MSDKTFLHFNTKIKITERNKLTRENYCVLTTQVSNSERRGILFAQEFFEKNKRYPALCPPSFWNVPNAIYADSEHYNKEWAEEYYKDCMENFELNMQYFDSLSREKFCQYLSDFQKRNELREIFDLKEVHGVEGIYILVLDEYKQVYIGQSNDIKKRILRHWSSKKEFSQLLFGSVEESVLSIDSFGALDTTRIFYKSVSSRQIYRVEEKLVKAFDSIYLLNRVGGGLNSISDSVKRNLELQSSMNKRSLKE